MPFELDTEVTGSHWDTDYRVRHQHNYETIQQALNQFEQYFGLAIQETAVPAGLREIFDRVGIIGIGSYDFEEGVKSDNILLVGAGAFWNGADFRKRASSTNVSLAGLATGVYYLNIDASGTPSASASYEASSSVRSFHWNASTQTVSSKALAPGVSVLFDGDDYADMLTSAAKSKSYTKVADRLEDIEAGQDVFSGYYAQDLPHSGLNFKYKAGKVRNDSVITDTAAGQVTLADNATNYVEVDPATGAVSANTTGFTSGRIPLYQVVTASGEISTVSDKRTPAIAGTGGGGGGGHTQNTDTGTTATNFIIDMDAAGFPTGRAGLEVENGNYPNAYLQFNRDLARWEISVDGGLNYLPVPTIEDLFGQQEFSRFVQLSEPVQAYYAAGRGSSADWEQVDLTDYLSEAPNGATAAALLVVCADASPNGQGVMFRAGDSGLEMSLCQLNASASTMPDVKSITVPLSQEGVFEFYLSASNQTSATLSIVLLGYFARVTGVGTQPREYSKTNLNVSAGSQQTFDLTGFVNRGLVHYFKIEETGGQMTENYDVELFAKDTYQSGDLLYKATGIVPTSAFEDWLPFWVNDLDGTREMHLRIKNNDTSKGGTFAITCKLEQFA